MAPVHFEAHVSQRCWQARHDNLNDTHALLVSMIATMPSTKAMPDGSLMSSCSHSLIVAVWSRQPPAERSSSQNGAPSKFEANSLVIVCPAREAPFSTKLIWSV